MKRRDFITLIGGAATTWPLTVRAQQMRRIGMLLAFSESDLEGQSRVAAFQKGLQELGWKPAIGSYEIADAANG